MLRRHERQTQLRRIHACRSLCSAAIAAMQSSTSAGNPGSAADDILALLPGCSESTLLDGTPAKSNTALSLQWGLELRFLTRRPAIKRGEGRTE